MPRRATKDTIAYEPVGVFPGDDTTVRREVRAGYDVPDNWDLEDSGAVEEYGGFAAGLGAAPAAYKHQLDTETGQVKDEHVEDVQPETRVQARGKARGRGSESKAAGEGKSGQQEQQQQSSEQKRSN